MLGNDVKRLAVQTHRANTSLLFVPFSVFFHTHFYTLFVIANGPDALYLSSKKCSFVVIISSKKCAFVPLASSKKCSIVSVLSSKKCSNLSFVSSKKCIFAKKDSV